MALAKLCACAAGGALVGGGAVHVAETKARPAWASSNKAKSVKMVKRRPQVRRYAAKPTKVRRLVTKSTVSCPPAVVTVASNPAPIPVPPMPILASGGDVAPAVIGGGGWGGGGGFFGGGFFGGTGGGGSGSIVISSTGSTSTSSSTSSSTGGAVVDIDNQNNANNQNNNNQTNNQNNTNNNNNQNTNTNTNQQQQNQNQNQHQEQNQHQDQDQYGSSSKGWDKPHDWDKPPTNPPGSSGTSGDPSPVPAPPMVFLFGAAAAGLVARRRLAKKSAAA